MKGQPEETIKLALQGGGSHGAFTWGVLDQILGDERIRIEAVSGTSAGAMNAVALADGMARGGAAEARKCLERFWSAISARGAVQPDPAIRLRHIHGKLEPRHLAGLHFDRPPFTDPFAL